MELNEKKRKINETRRTQSKSTLPFPLDLISEILLRLPEKYVARFRCVSKLWLSITTNRYFINLFETRSPRPSLLLCFKDDQNLYVSSISQHHYRLQNSNKCYKSSTPIYRYHMKFPNISYYQPTESVHGLVCFQESATPIAWNPSTRKFLTLPKPRLSWNPIRLLLGYDPIEGKHKLMCLPLRKTCDICRVLTLGSDQESWRTVKTNHNHRSEYNTSGRCIKGVVYYLAYVYHTRLWVIMSFDVRYEKFDMIQLPSDIHKDVFINYEGKFACVNIFTTNVSKKITLCILEDAEKHKCSSKCVRAPFGYFDKRLRVNFRVHGFTEAGEFIYVSSTFTFHKSYYILFHDPVTKSFRVFELKGIVDDDLITNGRVNLHVFLNHVESQMLF